jgi:hypothetical protein
LADELNIEVGPDEELLYMDNCVPGEDGLCNRKVVAAGDDKILLRETLDEEKKIEKRADLFTKRKLKIAKDKAALEQLKAANPVISTET